MKRCTRVFHARNPTFASRCTLASSRTSDGGETWRRTGEPAHFSHHSSSRRLIRDVEYPSFVFFADASNGWVYGGETYRTRDGGKTWREDTHLPGTAQYIIAKDGVAWAITAPCRFLRCDARLWTLNLPGRRWEPTPAQPSCFDSLAVASSEVAVMSCHDVSVTTDSGQTWTVRPSPCTDTFHAPAIEAATTTEFWQVCNDEPSTGGQGLALFHSVDAGESWSIASESHECCDDSPRLGNPPIGGFFGGIVVTPDGDLFIAREKFGAVWRSREGTTWEQVLRKTDQGIVLIAVDSLHLWAFASNGCCLHRTDDGGETWEAVVK